jgi:hypothetical protein
MGPFSGVKIILAPVTWHRQIIVKQKLLSHKENQK